MFHPENAFQVQFRSLASLLRLHFFPQVGIDQFRINQLCKSPLQCNRLLTGRIIYVIYSFIYNFFFWFPLLQGQFMISYVLISCFDSPLLQGQVMIIFDFLFWFPTPAGSSYGHPASLQGHFLPPMKAKKKKKKKRWFHLFSWYNRQFVTPFKINEDIHWTCIIVRCIGFPEFTWGVLWEARLLYFQALSC